MVTVLKRWDGSRIWYPNSLVNVVPILNLTRSENKWEFFKVSHHTCLQNWSWLFLIRIQNLLAVSASGILTWAECTSLNWVLTVSPLVSCHDLPPLWAMM